MWQATQTAITFWIRLSSNSIQAFILINLYAVPRTRKFPITPYLITYKKMVMIFFALHLPFKGNNIHGLRNGPCFCPLTWMYYPERPQRPWLTYSMLNYVLNIYRSFSSRLHYNFAVCHKCKVSWSALWYIASIYYISIKPSNIYYGFITLLNDFLQLPMWSHYHSNSVIFSIPFMGFFGFTEVAHFPLNFTARKAAKVTVNHRHHCSQNIVGNSSLGPLETIIGLDSEWLTKFTLASLSKGQRRTSRKVDLYIS